VIERENEMARSLLKQGKKKQAVLALKKKKYQEQLLSKADAELENVQKLTDAIEFAQVQTKVFEGLKQGNATLKALHANMKLEDIENLMLDTEEAIAYQNVSV
jgi:charged multivesicular body protein 6